MRRPNLGWRCTHCDEGRYYGQGSADKAVNHIKEKHPSRYDTDDWQILPIRKKENENDTTRSRYN